MKISIDTKADSEHEIRKVIKLLIGLVGSKDIYSEESDLNQKQKTKNIFESETPAPNFMGMFDSAPSSEGYKEPDKEEFKESIKENSDDESPAMSQIDFY